LKYVENQAPRFSQLITIFKWPKLDAYVLVQIKRILKGERDTEKKEKEKEKVIA
jgi:hypothetical protein